MSRQRAQLKQRPDNQATSWLLSRGVQVCPINTPSRIIIKHLKVIFSQHMRRLRREPPRKSEVSMKIAALNKTVEHLTVLTPAPQAKSATNPPATTPEPPGMLRRFLANFLGTAKEAAGKRAETPANPRIMLKHLAVAAGATRTAAEFQSWLARGIATAFDAGEICAVLPATEKVAGLRALASFAVARLPRDPNALEDACSGCNSCSDRIALLLAAARDPSVVLQEIVELSYGYVIEDEQDVDFKEDLERMLWDGLIDARGQITADADFLAMHARCSPDGAKEYLRRLININAITETGLLVAMKRAGLKDDVADLMRAFLATARPTPTVG